MNGHIWVFFEGMFSSLDFISVFPNECAFLNEYIQVYFFSHRDGFISNEVYNEVGVASDI